MRIETKEYKALTELPIYQGCFVETISLLIYEVIKIEHEKNAKKGQKPALLSVTIKSTEFEKKTHVISGKSLQTDKIFKVCRQNTEQAEQIN